MKTLMQFIEESNQDQVFVLYMEDGTMVNYFNDEPSAEAEKKKLESENKDNKCSIKKEKKSNFEKNDQ